MGVGDGLRLRKGYNDEANPINVVWPLLSSSSSSPSYSRDDGQQIGVFGSDWSAPFSQREAEIFREGPRDSSMTPKNDFLSPANKENHAQTIKDSMSIGLLNLGFAFLNFLLLVAALVLDVRFKDDGLNFTSYAHISQRLTGLEFFVATVLIKLGKYSGGSNVVGMFLVTFLYQLVNGFSAITYSQTVSEMVANSTKPRGGKGEFHTSLTKGIYRAFIHPLFNYIYFQSVSASLYSKSLLPMSVIVGLISVLNCAIMDPTSSTLVRLWAFVCSAGGIQGIAVMQSQSNIIYHGLGNKKRDVVALIIAAVMTLVTLTPWGIYIYYLASIAANNIAGAAAIPWFFWIIFFSGFLSTLLIAGSAIATMVVKFDWFSLECSYLALITFVNLAVALSLFLGVTLTMKVDQNIGMTAMVSHA